MHMESKSDTTLTKEELASFYHGVLLYGEYDQCQPLSQKIDGHRVNYLKFGTGAEKSFGCALVIPDLEQVNIEALSTYDLTGCIGLAMRGTNKETGKQAAFFGHLACYDTNLDKEQNPMRQAIDFVTHHKDLIIFWGTEIASDTDEDNKVGLHSDKATASGPKNNEAQKMAERWEKDGVVRAKENSARIQQGLAQQDLSSTLGVWVRSNTFVKGKELTFFPHLPILVTGEAPQAVAQCFSDQWHCRVINDLYSISSLHQLKQFQCDHDILRDINTHLHELKETNDRLLRNYFHDDRRQMKIDVLERVAKAYRVGDFDTLHTMATQKSPLIDKSGSSLAFAGKNNQTQRLVQQAWKDSLQKKLKEPNRGGLTSQGEHILGRDNFNIQKDMKAFLQQKKTEPTKVNQSDNGEQQGITPKSTL